MGRLGSEDSLERESSMSKKTNEERVAEQAARALNDTKWDALRRPAVRRFLAVASFVAVLANSALYLLGTFVGLIGLVLLFGTYLLLRVSVRSVADLPDRFLDERMRSLRSMAYYRSYMVVSAALTAIAVLLMVLWIANDLGTTRAEAIQLSLDWNTLQSIVWLILGTTMVTPSAVVAFTQAKTIH